MAITLNTIQALTPTSRQDAGVYGLLTGSRITTDTTTSLFGQRKQEGVLSESQQQTITQLQDYVKENVSGPQAEAILKDLDGLTQLMKFGNSSASFNALSQLLGGNSGLSSSLTSGSLINQLV